MPQQQTSPSDPTSSQPDPSSDFGANEWLVEEMYDQFTRDPGSVDPTWVAYFKKRLRQRQQPANGDGPGRDQAPPRPPPRRAAAGRRPSRPAAKAPVATAPATKAPAEKALRRRRSRLPQATPRPGQQGGRAGQGHRPPGAEGEGVARPRRGRRPADVHRAARRARPHRRQHGRLPERPHRHLGPVRPGQAALGQPDRHQQPPVAGPRRQGLVHPPDRLRAGQGAQGDARDERRLRRHRRQAHPDHAGPHQPRPGHRHAEEGRHPPAPRAQHQGRRDHGLRRLLDRLRGHRAQGARRQAHRRGLRRVRRSRSPTPAPSAPTTRCRA